MTDKNPSNDLLPMILARLGLGKATLPPGAETQVDQLVKDLNSQDWSIRAAAARAMGKLRERTPIEPLVTSMDDENDVVRATAAQALGMLGERTPLEPLIYALHDSSWRVRAAAILSLSRMGDRVPIDELAALVNDEDESVCIAALQALGEMGERTPIEMIVLGLIDQDWTVREAAVMALGNLGQRAPVEPLVAALQDKDSLVREAARRTLKRAHPDRFLDIITNSKTEQLSPEFPSDTDMSRLASEHQQSSSANEPGTIDRNVAVSQVDQPGHPTFVEPIHVRPQRRPVPRRQPFSRRIAAIGAAALIAASLIVVSLATLPRLFSPPGVSITLAIGDANFANSLTHLVSENSGLIGINDELQIDLHDLSTPASGKSYYGWLLGSKEDLETNVISLGRLPFSRGKIHYLYKNPARQNLLATTSFFLITEENSNVMPLVPTPDHSQWRYSAEISQVPNPADTLHHYSLFDHIQHLLAKDPTLESAGLKGGVGFWLVRNAGKVGARVQMAQLYWKNNDAQQVRNQIIGILDYLDGVPNVGHDVSQATPLEAPATFAHIGLLQTDPQGYLEHAEFHLSAIAQNPDSSANQKSVATRLIGEINKINAQCEMVHQDALALMKMTDAQLLQPATFSLLTDMTAHAELAANGSNQQVQLEGAEQVFIDMQGLARFDVEVYQQ